MVDHAVDLRTTASPRRADRARPHSTPILRAGEAAAFPPEETSHWGLRARVGVVVGLATLSWVIVGAGLLLLLHHW